MTHVHQSSSRSILNFKSPEMEMAFIEHYSRHYYRFAQWSVCFGFVLLLGDFLIDVMAHPELAANYMRLYLGAPLTLSILLFSLTRFGKAHWQTGMSVFLFAVSCCVFYILRAIDAEGGSGLNSWVGILNFTFMEFYGFLILGIRYRYALMTGIMIMIVFLLNVHIGSPAKISGYWLYHVGTLFLLVAGIGFWRELVIRRDFAAKSQLAEEKARYSTLLESLVPRSVINRLNSGEEKIADVYPMVSVVFADLRGFTAFSSQISPQRVVATLHSIFSGFDKICAEFELDKIKTIGDAYMSASGLKQTGLGSPENALLAARKMVSHLKGLSKTENLPLGIRIGIHTGTVLGGVIDVHKPQFDIWGNVVNLASRMESTCDDGMIQVTEITKNLLEEKFEFIDRGEIEIKGLKDKIRTFLHDPDS